MIGSGTYSQSSTQHHQQALTTPGSHPESSQQQHLTHAPNRSLSPPPPGMNPGSVAQSPIYGQQNNALPVGSAPQSAQLPPTAAIHAGPTSQLPASCLPSSIQHKPAVNGVTPPNAGPDDGISTSNAGDLPRNQTGMSDGSSQSPIVSHRSNSFVAVSNISGHATDSCIDSIVEGEIDSDNEDITDELRKLDEDLQKNLERANKVFVNRMENLQRSQIEREAQHLKTLEKHEKESAEFEKRLAQEAEQQQRRIEQLQRDWDKRRETVALHKRRLNDGAPPLGELSHDFQPSSGSTPPGHVRSTSATSSNFSASPAMASHKLSQDPNGEGGSTER